MSLPLSNQQINKYHELTTEKLTSYGRSSLLAFTKYTMPEFVINWHHRILSHYLDQFASGNVTRLMVFMPPRHGKSELASCRLPAYLLGQDPDLRILACSYGDSLASTFNRTTQRIIDSPRYRDLFPDTTLAGPNERKDADRSAVRNNTTFEVVGRRGIYESTGLQGTLTGKGGNVLLVDDPVKNQQEADSEVYRNRMHEWYSTTFRTRLEHIGRPGRILITLTRWHEDDLAGRLLAEAKANPKADQWTVLSFPAIREDMENPLDPRKVGEALWPAFMNVDDLSKVQAGSRRTWVSLYQQRPAPADGEIVKRGWWKFYRELPQFDTVIQSWDLTYKDSEQADFVVGQVWGRKGADKYLLDQVRARMSFTNTLQAFRTLTAKWPSSTAKYVEEAANGAALIDTLRKQIPGIIAVRPKGTKINRAQAVSPQIEAGNIYLPDPSMAPWVHDYLEEWAVFPNGKNDDQVDSTTQAISKLTDALPSNWVPIGLTQVSKWRR